MAILFRDEDKLSHKLIECINKFLLKDGPNLGCHAMEIHSLCGNLCSVVG